MRLFLLLLSAMMFAQDSGKPPIEPVEQVDFICPMDKDIRMKQPGVCPRCGMKLVAGIPDGVEYPVNMSLKPRTARPGQDATLEFQIVNPATGETQKHFEVMHEKLFHLFLVSEDLQFFRHDHPVFSPDGIFRYKMIFPKGGLYRVLSDIYPTGGVPQMDAKTVIVPGGQPFEPVTLLPDVKPQQSENLRAELVTEPPQPIAGMKTLLFFNLSPADGLEQYLGAWGHMLAASWDLIDLIHSHPFIANGGPQVQFNLLFPREGVYRVWVQFQRKGVVNTFAFNVPVTSLR